MYVPLRLSDSRVSLESCFAYCNSLMNISFYSLDCEMLPFQFSGHSGGPSISSVMGPRPGAKLQQTHGQQPDKGGFDQLEDSGSHLDGNIHHPTPCWAQVGVLCCTSA